MCSSRQQPGNRQDKIVQLLIFVRIISEVYTNRRRAAIFSLDTKYFISSSVKENSGHVLLVAKKHIFLLLSEEIVYPLLLPTLTDEMMSAKLYNT